MKTLRNILGEGTVENGLDPVNSGYDPNDDPKMRPLRPKGEVRFVRKHLDAVVKIKNLVPGVTDDDKLFNASNVKRSVPQGKDTHGHTPVPADDKVYEDVDFEKMSLQELYDFNQRANVEDAEERNRQAAATDRNFITRYGEKTDDHNYHAKMHDSASNMHMNKGGRDYDPALSGLHRKAYTLHRQLQKIYDELTHFHITRLKKRSAKK